MKILLLVSKSITLCISILILLITFSSLAKSAPPKILGYINEDPLYKEEFLEYIQQAKSRIHHLYADIAETSDHFYSEKIDGVSIGEKLKSLALNNAITAKVELQYLNSHGVIPTSDYYQIIDNFKQKNTQRKDKHQNGEIIYGPLQYNKKMYLSLLKANAINKLKDTKKHGLFSNEEVYNYYISVKDESFRSSKSTNLTWFTFNNIIEQDDEFKHLYKNADLVELYKYHSIENPESLITRTFTAHSAKSDETMFPVIFKRLQSGELKLEQAFTFSGGNDKVYVVYVNDRKEGITQPFKQVRHVIERVMFEKKYNQKLQMNATNAVLRIKIDLIKELYL
jgi:hypothetical protein